LITIDGRLAAQVNGGHNGSFVDEQRERHPDASIAEHSSIGQFPGEVAVRRSGLQDVARCRAQR
jgi:hypothetical protein